MAQSFRKRSTAAVCGFVFVCLTASAAEFKVYPGAKTDAWAADAMRKGKAALPPGTESEVFVTPDAYEKVSSFYKQNAREVSVSPGTTLPDGTRVKWSFYVLDNARGLADSRLWLKVQRPSVADAEMKVRDITSIQVVRKK
ncbi:MAG: hypothetical protein ABI682_08975 [Acidobacteriota bacterium]